MLFLQYKDKYKISSYLFWVVLKHHEITSTQNITENRITKIISVIVPAFISSSLLLILQAFLSILVVFLPQVLILQHLVGPIDLQELLVGRCIILRRQSQRSQRVTHEGRHIIIRKLLTGFLSGCIVRASFLKACRTSRVLASLETPSSL